MPKFYCEYCGIYLTHSSPSGRKQHARGRKHINNKIEYYSQYLNENNALKNLNPFMRADTLPFMNMMNPLMKPGMMPGMSNLPIPTINVPGIMPTNITNLPLGGMGGMNLNPSTTNNPQSNQQMGMMNPNMQSSNMMPMMQPMQMPQFSNPNMNQNVTGFSFPNMTNLPNMQGNQS